MEALDLTKGPPRSPWVKLGGAYMLARTIDKLRASLPEGNMGDYKIPGFSERLLKAFGIEERELREVVSRAAGDAEVAAWVRSRTDDTAVEAYNERASQRRIADVADRAEFVKRYPIADELPEETTLFDMIDEDDRRAFARS